VWFVIQLLYGLTVRLRAAYGADPPDLTLSTFLYYYHLCILHHILSFLDDFD
jgi:hypothetical protein